MSNCTNVFGCQPDLGCHDAAGASRHCSWLAPAGASTLSSWSLVLARRWSSTTPNLSSPPGDSRHFVQRCDLHKYSPPARASSGPGAGGHHHLAEGPNVGASVDLGAGKPRLRPVAVRGSTA